ncbi:MAG TPA: HDIG domain-containing protein [Gemmatimonadaceae bacterium]|nr:HDIG domain-containing protein [Gemmatimonadaceae bacterium]
MNLWRQLDRIAPRAGMQRTILVVLSRAALIVGLSLATVFMFSFGDQHSPSATHLLGHFLSDLLVLSVFAGTLALYRPQLYKSFRAVALFALLFLGVLGVAAAVARAETPHVEFVPIAMMGILLSVLFDPRVSVFAALVLATLIDIQPAYHGTDAPFILLVGGVAAAFSVRVIRRRDQAYYSILVTAAAYVMAEIAIGLTDGWPARQIWWGIGFGIVNAIVSVALALMLLPTLEELTGVDTYLKLLEWSDLNRPLMQRLSVEAPGTFAHSMRLANLAEAACNAIGANGLLSRVGAYYHDIGKLKKPEYFVENQPRGRNPHDKLKPATSAAIIRNHVREGLELAAENSLPTAIRSFITEHHGTAPITYFLEKAKERDGTPTNPADFAYPGPIPQSSETAICMLGDGIEASAHVLHDPTPAKIREVVDHIVRQRIDQGQLRDAPLTLKQLEVIKEQFVRVLVGMYHHRIDYPTTGGGVTSEFASVSTP